MSSPRYRSGKLKLSDKVLLGTAAFWLAAVTATAVHAKGKILSGGVKGNGDVIEELRPLSEFNEVSVNGSIKVDWSPGPRSECRLTAESNVMPKLQTNVDGKSLEIRLNGNIFTSHTARAVCTSPSLQAFTSKGTSNSSLTDVSAKDLSLTVQGTGNITAIGEVERVSAIIQGTGTLLLDDLSAKEAELNIQGTGSIRARKADEVRASIAGTGSIYISKDAKVVSEEVRGVGRVRRE